MLSNLGLPVEPRARLVYHPEYVTSEREAGARHAFDVHRAAKVIEQLYRAGVLSPAQVLSPEPPTRAQLELVHTAGYLDELAVPGRLAELLFMPRDPFRDNALYQAFLRQTGGTILAAEQCALGCGTVFNLGGGFHHAQRDRAEGFCALNDVAIAARHLQSAGLASRILVIDLDFHPGNGTALIFHEDESVFTFSVHGQSWHQVEGKRHNLDVELPPGTEDETYLRAVRRALELVLERFHPDVAFYVAGADPHEEDTFGDFRVSDDGMLDRDLHVWERLRAAAIPCVVTLAGGYSPFAWTIAYNFVFSVLTGHRIEPAYRPGNIEAQYRRIKAKLTVAELRAGLKAEEDDLQEIVEGRSSSSLFMGTYTERGLMVVLERYGFFQLLREKGFEQLSLTTHASDPERQIARIYHGERPEPANLLVELVVRYRNLVVPREAAAEGRPEDYRLLSIEWLLMQNPVASFSLDRQRFPGQRFPGLGLGRWMVELLRMMAERLDCDGLMNIPEHYHNAYLYSKQMLFFDPADQGRFEAIRDTVRAAGLPLVEASEAIDAGRLRVAETGEVSPWEGKPQVMPVKPVMNAYFARPVYIQAVAAARERFRFVLG
jgi:acetoin utilization deacetylase AcuC-like enzyme